jgi:hypothetical protein
MNDYVKPVAKAYGDGSPDLHSIAKRQLEKIDAERGALQAQAYTIRQLIGLRPPPSAPVNHIAHVVETGATSDHVSTAPSPPTSQSPPSYITDEQKRIAREIWMAERQGGRDLSSQEVVDLMRGRGIAFGVAQPAAAIGMTLASIRREWQATHPEGVTIEQ